MGRCDFTLLLMKRAVLFDEGYRASIAAVFGTDNYQALLGSARYFQYVRAKMQIIDRCIDVSAHRPCSLGLHRRPTPVNTLRLDGFYPQ